MEYLWMVEQAVIVGIGIGVFGGIAMWLAECFINFIDSMLENGE